MCEVRFGSCKGGNYPPVTGFLDVHWATGLGPFQGEIWVFINNNQNWTGNSPFLYCPAPSEHEADGVSRTALQKLKLQETKQACLPSTLGGKTEGKYMMKYAVVS